MSVAMIVFNGNISRTVNVIEIMNMPIKAIDRYDQFTYKWD